MRDAGRALGALGALGLSLVFVIVAAGSASAQTSPRDEARTHFTAGEARFKAGDFKGAIREFRAADKLVPSALLTYNVALCYDKLGDANQAAALYRQYLDKRPDAPNRAQVQARIDALAGPAPLQPYPPRAAPAPDGDGLATPRPGVPPEATPGAALPGAEPRRRSYDDAFAKRLPTRVPETASGAPAPEAAGPPPSVSSGELPGPGQAEQAPPPALHSSGDAEPAPRALAAPPAPDVPRAEQKPIYKQWWFWAIVGVGTFIAVDVAVHAGDSSTPSSRNGLLLFHF
jgi:hypothetical protein